MWTRYTRGGAWSAWEQMNSAYSLPVNSVTATSPITDFKIGFTITYVNDAGATGFPDNIGGILTTYRQSTTNGWSYQEYKKYNSWDKYIRYCDTSGVWSEWKQFTLV
jgi:hypothetical protein